MQDLSIEKQILVALNEVLDKRRFCAISFAIISMIVVLIGLKWPKIYESSTTILWNKSQVVKPLLEGTVVTSSDKGQAKFAREVIYSNKNLDTLIQKAELNINESGESMSERDLEILKSELRKRILIERGSNDILRISYKSQSAEEAFLVVSIVSKLFMEETTQNIKADSVAAYNFIQNQVDEYQAKLNEINERINQFRMKNIELQVETTQGVNTRISTLNDQINTTSLNLKEAIIQRDSLLEQLEIESSKSIVEKAVNVKNKRLVELENQLNTLRLSYTETYPDIVQLKEQIEFIKNELEADKVDSSLPGDMDKSATSTNFKSALYDRLRRQIADQETVIRTLEARKLDQEKRFKQEIAKSSEVNLVVSKLEELSRDRLVTKQLYDELLAKRENARVSLNLELESAGSLFKVQEPPVIPLVPKGIRFLHFSIASVILGAIIPVGIILAFLLVDPRVRHEDQLELADGVPVIGVIPSFETKTERRKQRLVTLQSIVIFSCALILVAAISLSRYFEAI